MLRTQTDPNTLCSIPMTKRQTSYKTNKQRAFLRRILNLNLIREQSRRKRQILNLIKTNRCFFSQSVVRFLFHTVCFVYCCLLQSKHSVLFESSDDDEDGKDRFRIKPQFEGKAGQKVRLFQSEGLQIGLFDSSLICLFFFF